MAGRPGSETHHVVPNPSGGWDVRRGGAERATGHYDINRRAIDPGRQVRHNQETEVHIHNRDGRIAQSDRHGWDPNPPKG